MRSPILEWQKQHFTALAQSCNHVYEEQRKTRLKTLTEALAKQVSVTMASSGVLACRRGQHWPGGPGQEGSGTHQERQLCEKASGVFFRSLQGVQIWEQRKTDKHMGPLDHTLQKAQK